MPDCAAAKLIQGGPKSCKFGCIGFGNCVRVCPFDALSMGDDGLPVVDKAKCTGCGKCAQTCPQQIISLTPFSAPVEVSCSSHDKGAAARKACKNACLGCGLCMRNCSHGAIKIENNLAVVNPGICKTCEEPTCLAKCPTKAIESMIAPAGKEEKTA